MTREEAYRQYLNEVSMFEQYCQKNTITFEQWLDIKGLSIGEAVSKGISVETFIYKDNSSIYSEGIIFGNLPMFSELEKYGIKDGDKVIVQIRKQDA